MRNPIQAVSLTAAQAAKLIRADLKKAFPETKFSVRCSNFSQGSSVDVSYTDGPTTEAVEAMAQTYGRRGFDGSDDSTYYVSGEVAKFTAEGIIAPTYRGFVDVWRRFSDEAYKAMGFESQQAYFDLACREPHNPIFRDLKEWDFRFGYGARSIIVGAY